MLRHIRSDGEIACYYPNIDNPRLVLRATFHTVLGFTSYHLKGTKGKLLDFDIQDNGEQVDWLELMLMKMKDLS